MTADVVARVELHARTGIGGAADDLQRLPVRDTDLTDPQAIRIRVWFYGQASSATANPAIAGTDLVDTIDLKTGDR